MKKRSIPVLICACMLLFCACTGRGQTTPYKTEHNHVYGYWYDGDRAGEQVRYCKICLQQESRSVAGE